MLGLSVAMGSVMTSRPQVAAVRASRRKVWQYVNVWTILGIVH